MNTPLHVPATALIAEDEALLAQALQAELLKAWPELKVMACARDGEEAIEQALALRPEVLFLDIRMPGRTGLEAAQAIVEDWPEEVPLPLIVFVTAYDQYALQAFDFSAVDYVLKPVQPQRLAATCQRLRGLLSQRTSHAPAEALGQQSDQLLQQLRALLADGTGLSGGGVAARAAGDDGLSGPLSLIQASVGAAVHMVPVDEVVYFEAADKYIRVLTTEREYLIRTSLRELLPQLDAQRFWQVHRGTVVQATAIAQALRDEQGRVQLVLRQRPERLAVSRLYAARFKGM
jgi:DNA-binding LytR/AlgR family response regulator